MRSAPRRTFSLSPSNTLSLRQSSDSSFSSGGTVPNRHDGAQEAMELKGDSVEEGAALSLGVMGRMFLSLAPQSLFCRMVMEFCTNLRPAS